MNENGLTLFNYNGSESITNPSNTNMKVAVCYTNNSITLKDYTSSTSSFDGYQVFLVVSTDNGNNINGVYTITLSRYRLLYPEHLIFINNKFTKIF